MERQRRALRRACWQSVLTLIGLACLSGSASAHGGAVGGQRETLQIPFWLFASTGGGVVGASFLLASFVTDRALVDRIHGLRRRFSIAPGTESLLRLSLRILGVLGAGLTVAAAFIGPRDQTTNFAILLVWVAWWTGFTMSVYLVGNAWPAVNPWRAVLPSGIIGVTTYPDRFGAWPSVAGLLALVWLEVVSPVAEDPRVLGVVVLWYSVVTVTGAVLFGSEAWFRNVDPVSNVFRYLGAFAPVARRSDGFEVTWPGARLADDGLVDGLDETGFLVALLWVTTFDGLVSTPSWATLTRATVDLGVPPLLVYLSGLLVGYAAFLGAFVVSGRLAATYARTTLPPSLLRERFAASLLPISVGYHLAHYLGYFLSLTPTLLAGVADPLGGAAGPRLLVLPSWFGALSVAFVLLGHLVGIWVAHAAAFDLFPDRLQAIRSQYPVVAVMVVYTMLSLWIVTQPSVELAHL